MKPAIKVLSKEYLKIAGRLVAEYFPRTRNEDDIKSALKTQDFMDALLTGKDIRTEWQIHESQNFKDLLAVANAINFLTEKDKVK